MALRALEEDLQLRITNIQKQQAEVIKLEPMRQQKIREGLRKLLEEHVGKENYDPNRLEQELIYYIEKIDISEEQVRLVGMHIRVLRVLDERAAPQVNVQVKHRPRVPGKDLEDSQEQRQRCSEHDGADDGVTSPGRRGPVVTARARMFRTSSSLARNSSRDPLSAAR